MHTFKLLDLDGNGELDLAELARGVRHVESDGGMAMLQRIDISMDGKLSKEEWTTHFNKMAKEESREAALKLLTQLNEAAEKIAEAKIAVGEDGEVKLSLFAT